MLLVMEVRVRTQVRSGGYLTRMDCGELSQDSTEKHNIRPLLPPAEPAKLTAMLRRITRIYEEDAIYLQTGK
jgi:hypothetical protein